MNRQQSDCSFSSPPTSPDPNLEELSSSKTRLVFSLASPEAVSYPRLTEPYSPECLEDVSKDAEKVCERKESLSEREKENRLFEKRSNERQLKKNPWIVVGKRCVCIHVHVYVYMCACILPFGLHVTVFFSLANQFSALVH